MRLLKLLASHTIPYIEKADHNTAIANFKRTYAMSTSDEYKKQQELKAGLAENYLRGAGPELQAEKAPTVKKRSALGLPTYTHT